MVKRKTPTLRLDLAAGQVKEDGWTSVDLWEGADVVQDLFTFPWPWADNTVDEARSSHFVEHIPMEYVDGRDMLFRFMDECWRILKPGGRITIQHPHVQSERAFQDPTHRRFIPAVTWYYMNREWRKMNLLDHYGVDCDFDIIVIEGVGIADDVAQRHYEVQAEMVRTRWNTVADTKVILEARK